MIPGSPNDHPTFPRSFGYAVEGFVCAIKTERNIKVMLALGACAILVGFLLKLDIVSWCIILLCCGTVIAGELMNTALESVVDLATQELHPLAKRAKDIAAAAVHTLAIMAAIVGVLVYAHALGAL